MIGYDIVLSGKVGGDEGGGVEEGRGVEVDVVGEAGGDSVPST